MRRLPLLLLLALAACAGPRDAPYRTQGDAALADSASGAGSWSALCAAQKASCEVLG